jgi:hypothetical protein
MDVLVKVFGGMLVSIGIACLFLGLARYFMIQDALLEGNYPVSRISVTMLAFLLGGVVLAAFVSLLRFGTS